MKEKELKEYIRAKVLEFYSKEKVLKEEKEGPGKPTSGMKKVSEKNTHTDTKKEVKPKASKITPDAPEKSTLANAEPTEVDNEVRVMKEKDEPKKTEYEYECESMGIELKVKGASHADINSLYLISQVRKSLEGKGTKVKSIKIEMEDYEDKKEKVEESVELSKLRSKIREIAINEIFKYKK